MVNATPRPVYPLLKTRYPLYRGLGGPPGPVWTGAENLATTGIRSPDRPAFGDIREEDTAQFTYIMGLKYSNNEDALFGSGSYYEVDLFIALLFNFFWNLC